jgi:hypothetical protein
MLEHELNDLLARAGVQGRQRVAIARRLGWDGGAPTTLAHAGEHAGYTRERVRQLEERVVGRIAQLRPALPCTEAALAVLEKSAPASCGELATTLADERVAAEPFDPRGVIRAASLAGVRTSLAEQRGVVLRQADGALVPVVLRAARQQSAKQLATTVAEVASLLELPARRVRQLLALREEVVWLDGTRTWLTVHTGRSKPAKALQKLLAVTPDPPVQEVEQMLRCLRPSVVLPRPILKAVLVELRDRHVALSSTEALLVEILREEGPVARIDRLLRRAEGGGVAPKTAAVCLSRSPLFRQVARARWSLAA